MSSEVFTIRVITKASSNKVKIEELPDGTKYIRVYVTTVPEHGKANKEIIKLLSKEFGVPKSAIDITHGLKSKDKVVQIVKN